MIQFERLILKEDSESPLYLKLADALRAALAAGEVSAGERLPSVRRLSEALRLNPATAAAAYRILEQEGWVAARAGSGVYALQRRAGAGTAAETSGPSAAGGSTPFGAGVRRGGLRGRDGSGSAAAAAAGATAVAGEASALLELSQGRVVVPQGVLDLAAGTPSPALFPVQEFKGILDEVLDRDGGWAFGYQDSAGWEPFRRTLGTYAAEVLGIRSDAEDIRVVSGAQQGIDLTAKALLRPGDAVLTEGPTYRGATAAFWSRGADTAAVHFAEEGVDLAAWERAVRALRPRLVYLIPRYQNPTTRCWDAPALRFLLDLAEQHDFHILEDDLLSDLHYGAAPEPATLKSMDRHDRVIYVRGFSKVLLPGLRLGMLILPRKLRRAFEAAKRTSDISTDGFVQRAAELYLRRGLHRGRIEALRSHYGAVYRRMLSAAERRLGPLGCRRQAPEGGLHLWIRLPAPLRAEALYREALARGAAIVPEAVYGTGAGAPDRHVRLSFASLTAEEAERGVGIVADALAELTEQAGTAKAGDDRSGPQVRPLL